MHLLRRSRAALLAASAMGVLALAGCGSSSTSPAASSTGGTGSSGGSSQVRAAAAAVAPYEKLPTSIGQTQPLKQVPTGKVYDFIDDGTPIDTQVLVGVKQAIAAIGARLQVIRQRGDTPQAIGAAWDQIVSAPPSVVLGAGDPTELMQHQLSALKAKHVPVVMFFTNEDPLLAANIYGPPQYKQLGTLEADYVISKSDGKANVLVVAVPEIAGLQGTVAALTSTLKSDCSGCKVGTVDTQLSGIGSVDPGRVVSYMQQNPGTTWIVFVDGDTQIGVPEALSGANIHNISMMSGAGGRVNYEYIKKGLSTVDAAQPPIFSGWALVDAGARVLAGQSVQVSLLPLQFLTKSDLTFNLNSGWPDVANFRQRFESLWDVKK